MNKIVLFMLVFSLMGCGQTIRDVQVRNGVVTSYTVGEIGFRSSDVVSVTNSEHMTNCEAEIGSMPGSEEKVLCVQEARDNMRRKKMIRDMQAQPYYIYGIYGY